MLDGWDQLSDVSNGKIVFSRLDATFRQSIMVFDTSTSNITEIDPVTPSVRSNGAIGSNTVAFIDRHLAPTGELMAADIGGATVRVTNDSRSDDHPSVAPLGDLIVYESCLTPGNCDIRQAGRIGASWVVTNRTDNAHHDANPDTDGGVVVYDAIRAGQRDIYWQSVGGVTEEVLSLAPSMYCVKV